MIHMRYHMNMNAYQKEQIEALKMVVHHLKQRTDAERLALLETVQEYLDFRRRVDLFLELNFSRVCTLNCFQSRRSACCSRDGIITFFADVVVNVLTSTHPEIASLLDVLEAPHEGSKCVYLGRQGCLWQVKPIVCQMFLCEAAAREVFEQNPEAGKQWKALQDESRRFKWPDRPVLFDALEKYFLDAGFASTLMYLHTSPGLIRVKKKAGL